MKKPFAFLKIAILYVITGGAVAALMFWLFRTNELFQTLFYEKISSPSVAPASGPVDTVHLMEEVRAVSERAALLSFGILVFILLLQVFAFLTAVLVFRHLAKSTDALPIRLKKLENADLFLDLPLYFGLFGTVSSFVVMSFNPQVSRLIAYSSTLVGIIFSVFLRLTLQYPLRQRFIGLLDASSVSGSDLSQKGV